MEALTPIEARMLGYLAEHAGEWVQRVDLVCAVYRHAVAPTPREAAQLTGVHLVNLRRKLAAEGAAIHSVLPGWLTYVPAGRALPPHPRALPRVVVVPAEVALAAYERARGIGAGGGGSHLGESAGSWMHHVGYGPLDEGPFFGPTGVMPAPRDGGAL